MSQNNHAVYKELALGRSAKDISEDLSLSYSSVLRMKREYESAKQQGTLEQLMSVDRAILEHAAEDLDIPIEKAHELAKGMDGLENLNTALQQTALQINTKVQSYVMSSSTPSELLTYTDIICALQKAFLGKDVLIQFNNQQGGSNQSPAYKAFLGDKPGG